MPSAYHPRCKRCGHQQSRQELAQRWGSHGWTVLRGDEINQPQRLGEKGVGGGETGLKASAGQPAEAGPSRVTSLPPSPAPLSLAPCLPAVSRVGFGTVQAWPSMPTKGAVGLAPCLPGSRHLPFPWPAPHLSVASAAMRSPCARPCCLSQRRILGDAQAWPAEPGSADLVVKPAHRSAGCLTLSFGNGLCSLLLTAPLSRAAQPRWCRSPVGFCSVPSSYSPPYLHTFRDWELTLSGFIQA